MLIYPWSQEGASSAPPRIQQIFKRWNGGQITLALLQELLLALRANDADSIFNWFSLGVQKLGEPVVTELMMDWIAPLMTEEESDRLMAWQLGVSL